MSWLNQPSYTDYEGSAEPVEDPTGFFEGSLEAIPRGLGAAALRAGELTGSITAAALEAVGDEDADAYWRKVEQRRNWRMELGENRQGVLARVAGGVTEYGSLAIANPAFAAAAVFTSEAETEIAAGRDLTEATKLGAIRGGALYLGAKIPAALAPKYGLGKTLGYGAASNVGIGVTQRGLEYGVLGDAAAPVLDAEALVIDATLGALFGANGYRVSRKAVDASLDARAVNKVYDSAPVIPRDGERLDAHMQAVADSIKSAETGIPPDYSGLGDGDIDQRKAAEMDAAIRAINEDVQAEIGEPKPAHFTVEQYAKLGETDGGRIINADIARSLDPEFAAGRRAAKDVHVEASRVAEEAFAKRLKQVQPGKLPVAVFTAGGAGSGKSTALESAGIDTSRANVVYDATLKTLKNAVSRIEQAKDAGHKVVVNYVLADPAAAWGRALLRAEQTGREVPIDVFASTHEGALNTAKKLAAKYKNDPEVDIAAYDNRGKADDIREIPLAELAGVDYAVTREELAEIAHDLYIKGKIGRNVYARSVGQGPDVGRIQPEAKSGVPERAPEGGESARGEIPEGLTVVDEDGNAVDSAQYTKQLETESKQIESTISKMADIVQCLVRSANV